MRTTRGRAREDCKAVQRMALGFWRGSSDGLEVSEVYQMKAHQDFITWLLTVPRGRMFFYVSSKFGGNNKLRTNKPKLGHILQERGGRLTCREDKICLESLQFTNSMFRPLGHILRVTFSQLHISSYILEEPEKQSDSGE